MRSVTPMSAVRHRVPVLCLSASLLVILLAGASGAQIPGELSYRQYRDLAWAADRLDHMAQFEPVEGEAGMCFAIAERFGTVQVLRMSARGTEQIWKSNQLGGIPEEVLAADLSGDGLDDALVCRTSNGKIYAWDLESYNLVWESLAGEFTVVTCFTTANVDDDPQAEIVMIADNRIIYVDGVNFTKEFTSISEYRATMIRCGDVDGDRRMEIVLNSGQVVDSGSGDVEWEDETFFGRIEVLDIDGDLIPEVVTENEGGGPVKVFDVDYRSEVRFQ